VVVVAVSKCDYSRALSIGVIGVYEYARELAGAEVGSVLCNFYVIIIFCHLKSLI
jgi:hypothetical protein